MIQLFTIMWNSCFLTPIFIIVRMMSVGVDFQCFIRVRRTKYTIILFPFIIAAFIPWRKWGWSTGGNHQGFMSLQNLIHTNTYSYLFTKLSIFPIDCCFCKRFWVPRHEKRLNVWIQTTRSSNFHRSKLTRGTRSVDPYIRAHVLVNDALYKFFSFAAFSQTYASWSCWSCFKATPILS